MANREEFLEKIKELAKPMAKNNYFTKEEYEENKRMIERRKLYISEECMALNVYTFVGNCFRIMDKYKGKINFSIVMRAKSPKSSLAKQKRFNKLVLEGKREDSDLYDIVAARFVLKDIELDTKILSLFSDNVKARYNDTRANTYLLASVAEFYKKQEEMGGFYSETSKEGIKEMIDAGLTSCRTSFENITKNISRYNEKIGHTEIWRPELEAYIDQTLTELIKNEEKESRKEKYMEIKRFLIGEQTMLPEERDEQEEYYKYLIAVLCRLRKAEYSKCTKSYEKINKELYKQLMKFYKKAKKEKFNDNIELKDLTKLAKWSEELNLHLSDKLESQIIEEIMAEAMSLEFINGSNLKNSNLSVSLEQNEDQTVKIDKKVKSNGYVSAHARREHRIGFQTKEKAATQDKKRIKGKMVMKFEIQGTTDYRNHVSMREAAAGDQRKDELGDEKERKESLLPKRIVEQRFTEPNDNKLEECIVIEGFGRLDEMTEEQIEKCKRRIDYCTPNYMEIDPNYDNNTVDITIDSPLDNIRHYFGEIFNRKKQMNIRKGIEILEESGLVSSKKEKINMTREKYRDIAKNGGLTELLQSIVGKYEDYLINIEEETKSDDVLQQ